MKKARLLLLIFCTAFAGLAHAENQTSKIEGSLLTDIKKAQQKLNNTQRHISRARENIAKELSKLEQEVVALREETAVARRQADEKTLSLTQLESRLEKWQQQQAYQHNLIQRFNRQFNQPLPTLAPGQQKPTLSQQLQGINNTRAALAQRLSPQWQNRELVLPSGELENMQVLAIGPTTWFWSNRLQQGGLTQQDSTLNGLSKIGITFDGHAAEQLQTLFKNGTGDLTFDPSLNRAMAMAQTQESPIEHIAKGGLWAIPILAFAFFALSIAIFKTVQLWRLPKLKTLSNAQLQRATQEGDKQVQRSVKGMQKVLLDIAATESKSQARDDQLFNQLQHQQYQLNRWLGAIAITAAVSPLLGLLGTVSGMIETFKMMTLFGSGDPEVVSGGIAQALITTELGLVVAIPALILNAVLSRKAKNYYSQLENFALQMSQLDNTPANTQQRTHPTTRSSAQEEALA